MKKIFASLFALIFFFLGFSQNLSGVVNVYSKVLAIDTEKGLLKLSDVSGFGQYVGNKLMLIQMKGATIDETNSANFGNITAFNNTGNYEINTVCGFLSDTMVLSRKINKTYDVSGYVQIVIMPKITGDAVVTDTLKAKQWDRATGTGGVLALDVPGKLTINKPITASALGFAAGNCIQFTSPCLFTGGETAFYTNAISTATIQGAKKGEGIADYISLKDGGRGKQATGGGGGNNHNAGGGGGSNYGIGGYGGEKTNGSCRSNTPGVGGLGLSTYGYGTTSSTNRIFMGGGGGSGHDNDGYGMNGGNGGGIVYIKANEINANAATAADNAITANGGIGGRYIAAAGGAWYNYSWSDGAGGGGAGGTVILNVTNYTGSTLNVESKGGKGANSEGVGNSNCSGPGGGGGGGVVWLKQASTPATIAINVLAGTSGIIAFSALGCNGSASNATGGSSGATVHNFTLEPLRDSSTICSGILVIPTNVILSGQRQLNDYLLKAQLFDNTNVQQCILQKSTDNGASFVDIITTNNNNGFVYNYTDPVALRKVVYYRAKLIKTGNQIIYSNIVQMIDSTSEKLLLKLYPNPISLDAYLDIFAPKATTGTLIIYDAKGSRVYVEKLNLVLGINRKYLYLLNYMMGQYTIKLIADTDVQVIKFIKGPVF